MYFISAPFFLRWYYPQVTWNKPRTDKKIYLTFDDGPIPEITPWILETLAAYNAKAMNMLWGITLSLLVKI